VLWFSAVPGRPGPGAGSAWIFAGQQHETEGWHYRRKGGSSLMKDLAVLTPPFLVAAVVIIAIVAFVRHEMGRARVDRGDPQGNIPGPGPEADDEQDCKAADGAHAATTPAGDAEL
jgi:hypothetical protein